MAEDTSLYIDLRARTAKLEHDFARSQKKIRSNFKRMGSGIRGDLQKSLSGLGKLAAVAGVVVGVNQIKGALLETVAAGNRLQTTADKLGLTTTQLQELRIAGEQFNIAQTTTDMALQRFGRRLAEAAQGGGELKATLDQYGIAARDANGRMRSTTEVLKDYADVIQNAESEQEQLRLAFKAFDSEGVSFVNLMREGSRGLIEYTTAAHAFGQVIEREQIKKLAELDVALTRLKTGWAGQIGRAHV